MVILKDLGRDFLIILISMNVKVPEAIEFILDNYGIIHRDIKLLDDYITVFTCIYLG